MTTAKHPHHDTKEEKAEKAAAKEADATAKDATAKETKEDEVKEVGASSKAVKEEVETNVAKAMAAAPPPAPLTEIQKKCPSFPNEGEALEYFKTLAADHGPGGPGTVGIGGMPNIGRQPTATRSIECVIAGRPTVAHIVY